MEAGITDDERMAWKQSRVTQELLQNLKETKQETLELWAAGGYVGDSAEQTFGVNAKALGGVQAISDLIEHIESIGRGA